MPHPRIADLRGLLVALTEGGVELIVVGGAAAVMHGAPTTTRDLDVVHRRTADNVARFLAVLNELGAAVRDPAGRELPLTAEALAGSGQLLLTTRLGDLDVLCVLHDGRDFEQLLEHTEEMQDGGRRLRVLDLETLIEVKAAANRPKDRLVLPVLLALRERKQHD